MSKGPALILGARSDIAMAVAHRFAKAGYDIQLAARNSESLNIDKCDIELRYEIAVTLHNFDALDIGSHKSFVDKLPQLPTVALCAVGLMGEQTESQKNILAAAQLIRSNFEGPASILAALANRFEKRGSGTLVGISSVAGERGRATNYIYGSAKAGMTAFLSGLRNRLAKNGVHVVTVLPGFVATKMTDGMDLPIRLTAEPEEVAKAVFKAVKKSKNTIYVKPIWWLIMIIIKSIPERIFKKFNI
ncbi:MAG TPA: short-chain dehydrogenase [Rhodobacteraceae bacterium]|nr:short-chain dehydrogenase [Paracoccaceae bacterium]